ncbi:hypothetical protein BY996DRAFT_6427812 [Phakopsora pachyrhizi]|uniref:Expressed protein n=1 Tax=Phakopsora pachyrhizi TaxID=170000 RepID=A0AAV0ARJ5_PHAPC|nr:hypothetical protein BY996DRAFT_6427812 [Phakopsora pachyrhizi]CAH7671839.1 expressed protein [Phakopsora pachyrhizi]
MFHRATVFITLFSALSILNDNRVSALMASLATNNQTWSALRDATVPMLWLLAVSWRTTQGLELQALLKCALWALDATRQLQRLVLTNWEPSAALAKLVAQLPATAVAIQLKTLSSGLKLQ